MTTKDVTLRTPSRKATRVKSKESAWSRIKRGWQLYLLLFVPVAWLVVFQYYPMYGAQIAFRNFLPGDQIWDSQWVGLAHFRRFFTSYVFWRVVGNTLWLSTYTLLVGFPIPILFALGLNQLRNGLFKQSVQLISYAPHFISTVVMVGLLVQFLDLRIGPVNLLLRALDREPVHFMGRPEFFPSIYVWSEVWQHMGFNAIIYLAALTTIDPSLHEAAVVDGATRLQRIRHIDIPGIMPVAVILLILNMGQFLNLGFEKVLLLQNPLNRSSSEIIATYVYQVGLVSGFTNFSYAAAIGLFNSVVSLILLVIANQIAKKVNETSLW